MARARPRHQRQGDDAKPQGGSLVRLGSLAGTTRCMEMCHPKLSNIQQLITLQPCLQHTFGHQLVPLEDSYFQIRLHLSQVTRSESSMVGKIFGTTLGGFFWMRNGHRCSVELLNHSLSLQSRHQTVLPKNHEKNLGKSAQWSIPACILKVSSHRGRARASAAWEDQSPRSSLRGSTSACKRQGSPGVGTID